MFSYKLLPQHRKTVVCIFSNPFYVGVRLRLSPQPKTSKERGDQKRWKMQNLSHLVTPRCYDREEKCLWTATWQFIVKRRKIVSSQTCYKSLSVSFNCSTFYQCSAHFCEWVTTSFPLFLHKVVHFSFTLLTLRFAAVSMALNAIVICFRISCFILFVFVLINFAINTACFTSNFRYFHNFLRKKVTLCISVNFSLILTPGISSKEFSAAILLLQVDRRRQKTLLGKVVKPVKLFVYIYIER